MKKNLVSTLITSLLLVTALNTAHAAALTTEQETRIKALIHETLVKNPEILAEAAEALQKKQISEQASLLKKQIELNHKALYEDSGSPRLGAKNAKLTLVYFTDYNCPYCKRFDPQILGLVKKYPDLAVIIKPLPFLGASSKEAAELTSTVWLNQTDKFETVHHNIMEHKTRHDDASLKEILKSTTTVSSASTEGKQAVERNLELSQKLGIRGTPATVIDDQLVSGAVPIEELESLIKSKLK